MWIVLLGCVAGDAEGDKPAHPRPPLDDTATGDTATGDADTDTDTDTDTDADGDTDTDTDTDTTDVVGSGGSGGPTGSGTDTISGVGYAFYVPECAVEGPVAVVYTMHGSGGRGADMVGAWQAVAAAHCFMVVGLDSESSSSWNFSGDVDNFSRLFDRIDSQYDVAWRYLHGYSAGAHWTYIIGISNSELFAGMGVYAGSLSYAEQWGYWPDPTETPIPVAIAHGTADTTVPYSEAEHAYEELTGAGWPVDFYSIAGATHAYDVSCEERAWTFWDGYR